MVAPNNAWDRLYRAMRPTNASNEDGPWTLLVTGSVNLAGGGGAGGTSMVDNNPFTPGGTSITPAGGYVGGRTIASGNAGAIALSPSGAVLVHVIAGGAGGGLAQLQVVGSDNSNFVNVGWPSGGSPTLNAIPVQVMNQTAGGGGFASVGVYGSVQVVGSVGATQLGAPWSVVGSQGITGLGGSIGAVNLGGSVGATQLGAPWSFVGSAGVTPLASFTVNLASHIDTAGSAVRVNVVAGGAGGGLAQMQVVGSNGSTFVNVGYPSGGSPTFNSVPVLVMNPAGAGAAYASVGVYGSPAMPVYVVGSEFIVNGSLPIINLGGSVGALGIGGSMGVTQIGAPWAFVGSAGVTGLGGSIGAVGLGGSIGIIGAGGSLGAVNLGGSVGALGIGGSFGVIGGGGSYAVYLQNNIPSGGQYLGQVTASVAGVAVVDPRGSLVPTTFAIQASGGTYLVASMSNGNRIYLYGVRLMTTATVDVSFMSPSGTYLEGSQRLLPGAGWAENGVLGSPLVIGAAASGSIFLNMSGAAVIGGVARAWIGP